MLRPPSASPIMSETRLSSGFHASSSAGGSSGASLESASERQRPRRARRLRPDLKTRTASKATRTRAPYLVDLRRRDSVSAAGAWVLLRAEMLPDPDRALLVAVFDRGESVVQLARLRGADAATLRRRVRSLLARLASPIFVCCWRRHREWPGQRRRVAQICVFDGRPQHEAARELGLSAYAVREHIRMIQCLARQEKAAKAPKAVRS